MMETDEPTLEAQVLQNWPEQLTPAQDILKNYASLVDAVLDSCIQGNPKVAVEGFSKTFLERYQDLLPREELDRLTSRRLELVKLNSQEPATQL